MSLFTLNFSNKNAVGSEHSSGSFVFGGTIIGYVFDVIGIGNAIMTIILIG